MGNGPIFIGGLSFSGKTQLRQLISWLPNVVITRRTSMWTRFFKRYGDLSQGNNFERCLEAMLKSGPIRALQPDPEQIRKEFWQGPLTYPRLFALFHEHFAKRMGKTRWGDQLKFIERLADPILTAYPAAQMIQLVRDPRERCAESLSASTYRKGKVGWETAQWSLSARLAGRNQKRYPGRYMVVGYEKMLANPAETLCEICNFLREDFAQDLTARTIEQREMAVRAIKQYGEQIHSLENSASSSTLTLRERAFVEARTRHEMLAFGYPTNGFRLSTRDWLAYLLVDWPANAAGAMLWGTWGRQREQKVTA